MRERDIFIEALEKGSHEELAAYLDAACAGDIELRARVDQLLAEHRRPDSFILDSPPAGVAPGRETRDVVGLNIGPANAPMTERPGTQVGRYKLLEVIGEGGMGVVYLAEQRHPVRRTVALKVIKAGMDSRQVVARFEAERQALAMMDHPNIAKVLDGGTTESGRPYFVMELVQGVPITEYCDGARATARERLELFLPVCRAVQHAHTKGVIHRDLKPANVLVPLADGKPAPKVIDFGIAKATDQDLADKTLFTHFAQLVGTPLYMSPEQASGGADVDTRSDVYSLGVMLYELLTGTTPFDRRRLGGAAYDEIRRIIREEDPPKPSTRISTLGEILIAVSDRRGTDPKKLGGTVRGELDWIVMRAMAKDRARRYATAESLAEDVERYLADEAVHAGPPSATYELRKFVSRNRLAVTTSVVLAVMLLATASTIGWAARDRAARRAEIDREMGRALQEAVALRDRGDWQQSRAKLERAESLIAAGGASSNGVAAARRQTAVIKADLEMVTSLESIRLADAILGVNGVDRLDNGETRIDGELRRARDLAYPAPFKKYGIDITALGPPTAAVRIRASAIRETLLATLEDWMCCKLHCLMRDSTALANEKTASIDAGTLARHELKAAEYDHLRAVADLVAPDEWRSLVRDRSVSVQHKVRAGLDAREEVAARPSSAVTLLAELLVQAGMTDEAIRVLRLVHLRAPDDVVVSRDLASLLWRQGSARREEAAGLLQIAFALNGGLRIVTIDGRAIVIRPEPRQIGFDKIAVSPDGNAVGWVGVYHAHSGASYPIPLALVIHHADVTRSYAGNGTPVWKWRFFDGGKRVAFGQESAHGGYGVNYELRNVADGTLVERFEPAVDVDNHVLPDQSVPAWVEVLSGLN